MLRVSRILRFGVAAIFNLLNTTIPKDKLRGIAHSNLRINPAHSTMTPLSCAASSASAICFAMGSASSTGIARCAMRSASVGLFLSETGSAQEEHPSTGDQRRQRAAS